MAEFWTDRSPTIAERLLAETPGVSPDSKTDLLARNTVHEKILLTTWFGRKQLSRLYNLIPWTSSRKDVDTFNSAWKQFNFAVMREAEAKQLPCPIREVYQEVLAGNITEIMWLQTIDEILFTNLDVTSGVLSFLLINLAINQPAQAELRAEIQQVGTEPTAMEDYIRKTNTLLEYTGLESGRLCPPVWFTLPEYAAVDIDIGGYRIKAGTVCLIDTARLNTESRVWTPEKQIPSEPEVNGRIIYPQRFRSMSPTTYRWSLLRFGMGGRQCMGKNFASRMTKQFLVEVLTRYRVELDGERPVKQWGALNVELRDDRFTIMPKQNIRFVKI
ncbi:cytochrome P450 [Chaetomidium leptoderma]|uniref:Cytochrome P450 n=1 Tax=Chaetomidium leptoderma TaxID=669021 RepID=A0AAN6ZYF4_9PEZI|nr:cytochrome P450 [Chaetomidium leptoderma]